MSIANIGDGHEPRPAASAHEYGPITASEPLPVPLPVGITRSQLTADPPPVRTKPSMIDGIAPEVALFAPAAQRKATREALQKAPSAAPPQPVELYGTSPVAGGSVGAPVVDAAPAPPAAAPKPAVAAAPAPVSPAPVPTAAVAPVTAPAVAVSGTDADTDSFAEARWLFSRVLRFSGDEHVALVHKSPGEPHGRQEICTPAEALEKLPALRGEHVWVSANATSAAGRRVDDITRLTSLYADLDVKDGAFGSKADAAAIVDTLGELLGTPATAVVDSGGGFQPLWLVADGHIGSDAERARARAVLAGWGRLVAQVAAARGAAKLDNVYEVARVLRIPGSWNHKAEYGSPRPVHLLSGATVAEPTPLTLADIEAVLQAHGCLANPRSRTGGGVLATATPGAWPETDCAYAQAVLAAWEDDLPDKGRHSWHLHRATRLAAMKAAGCVTEDTHAAAEAMIDDRLAGFRAGDGSAEWGETERNHAKAVERTEGRTVSELLADELGGHSHGAHLRAVTPEYMESLAESLEADAAGGGTTINMPSPGGTNLRVEVGREGLLARATRCRAAAETMRRGGRATTAVQLPDGLPAVHPMLGDYWQRSVNERGSSQFNIDWTIPAADLVPNDLRPLREAVHGPRGTDKPLVLPAEEATCAQAIAKAVGGRKLARDVERSGTRDFLLSWAGSCWVKDGDAGEVCVQALMHPHLLDTDPAVRQQKIVVFGTRKPDAEEEAEQRQAAMEAAQARGVVFDPTKWRPHPVPFEDRAWASSDSRTRAIARRVTRQLEVAVPDTNMFDADPFVVGTPGGYLLLGDTVTVIASDPARLVTKLMGAAYDPGRPRGRWLKFMSEFQPAPEVRSFLQRLTGAALVGRQDEHILPNLSGEGGNGKGVFLEILRYAFGDYGVMMQTRVLTVAGSRGHATDLMPLKGARLAVFNEVPGVQLDAEQLKIINGGGTFSARAIAENAIEFPLSHMSWMSTNNLLEVAPGNRRAIRRRLRQIPCRADFSGLAGSSTPIVGLAAKIWEAEGPGIVAWIVEGYLDYRRRGGLDVPAAIDAATDEALAATSTWSAFCAEAFQVTRRKEDVIDVSPIFTTWRHYRGETSDQAHSRPGNERAVPKLLAQELHGIWTEASHGRQRARAVGLVWTDDGRELLKEATSGPFPFRPSAP